MAQPGAQPQLAPCEYKTGKTLGHGSYATVKEAVQIKTGKRFAVKVISKQLMRGKEAMILNEIEVLKKVSRGHENIVTLWDYFETPNNLYLVMDLCTGGELFDRICEKGSYYETDAADIIRVVVSAISYLHSQNIVHRDIKAENLLFKSRETSDPRDLVIADFGLSKMMDEDKAYMLMTTCGTPGYMAPEGNKLCGYTPFDANSQAEEIQNILKGRYSFEPREYWEDVSEDAKDFIRRLLVVPPNKRLTPEEALAHPWLNKPAEMIVPDDEVLFGSSVASTTMMSYGSVGGAVAGALAEAMDTHGTPLMAPNSAGSATVSALPSPSAPERPPSPPPPVPEPDTRYEDAEEPAGIAIPGRKSGYSTPQRQLLGASAPPDVIYQMMNSLNQITVSYDPVASLPGTAMLSRSVAPFGMSLPKPNLINHVRFNFNARRTFRRAVDTVKAVNRLQHAVTHESPSISRAASKQGSASDLNGRDGSEDSDETAIRSVSPNIGVLPKPELEKDGSEGTLSNGDMELDS